MVSITKSCGKADHLERTEDHPVPCLGLPEHTYPLDRRVNIQRIEGSLQTSPSGREGNADVEIQTSSDGQYWSTEHVVKNVTPDAGERKEFALPMITNNVKYIRFKVRPSGDIEGLDKSSFTITGEYTNPIQEEEQEEIKPEPEPEPEPQPTPQPRPPPQEEEPIQPPEEPIQPTQPTKEEPQETEEARGFEWPELPDIDLPTQDDAVQFVKDNKIVLASSAAVATAITFYLSRERP